jgi:multidrug resistance efflux pump
MSADMHTPTETAPPGGASRESAEGDSWRPVGFRTAAAKAAAADVKTQPVQAAARKRRSQPIPSRPTNRVFTGCLLIAVLVIPCYGFWSSYFRYPARGVVRARVICLSAPWLGAVEIVHVREGDAVTQGQPLVTLRQLELENQLDSIRDRLRVAQADLQSQATQLIWQSELRGDRGFKAWGEYYEAWGNLMQERARLAEAVAERDRHEGLHDEAAIAVSARQLDNARFAVTGQSDKVEKLEQAVSKLRERAEMYEKGAADVASQMIPQMTSIETLQSQLNRLRARADENVIRSPVNGHVVRLHRFVSEVVSPDEPTIEIVEDGSVEIALYVAQRHARYVEIGSELEVAIEPNEQTVACVVERRGKRLEPAPEHIQRHYAHNARLLPVIAHPAQTLDHMYLGSEVKLSWSNFFWPTRRSSTQPNSTTIPDMAATPAASARETPLASRLEQTR